MRIASTAELGLLLRATRRVRGVKATDLAHKAQVGHVFVRDVEHGKPTAQLGRVLQLLAEMGIVLEASVSAEVQVELEKLQAEGLRPLKPRRKTHSGCKL